MAATAVGAQQVVQPWNGVVWPPAETAQPSVTTSARMRAIPAIGRGLAVIEGMLMQMPMDAVRGDVKLQRPRLLQQPDPTRDRAWFVAAQVDDYLVHGNAVCLVTSRDATHWPATVMHLPVERVDVTVAPAGVECYYFDGHELHHADVVHVRRGLDPLMPQRGVGILEQYMAALGRIDKQGRYEESVLDGSAVPSVVVTVSQGKPSNEELDDAADRWSERFSGPTRRPVFLPNGMEVKPLSWSPADSQLVEARQLSLTDAANLMNLDSFWVGGSASSGLTYRSPGPMWLNLLRQTGAPILEQFELTWSQAWLPYGQRITFDRRVVLAEDMSTAVSWTTRAVRDKIVTKSEARVALGFSAEVPAELEAAAPPQLAQLDPSDDDNNLKEGDES